MSEKDGCAEADSQLAIKIGQELVTVKVAPEPVPCSLLREAIGISCACCSDNVNSPKHSTTNLCPVKSSSTHSSLSERLSGCGKTFVNVMGSHRWRSKKLKAKIASDFGNEEEKQKYDEQEISTNFGDDSEQQVTVDVATADVHEDTTGQSSHMAEKNWEYCRPIKTEASLRAAAPTPNNSPVPDIPTSQADPLLHALLENKLSPTSSSSSSHGSKSSIENEQGINTSTFVKKKTQNTKCCKPIKFKGASSVSPSNESSSSTSISKYENKHKGHNELSPHKRNYNRSFSNSSEGTQDTFEYSVSLHNYQTESFKLICRICRKAFDDPRLLPCLHTFCCKCIDKLKKHCLTTKDSASFNNAENIKKDGEADNSVSQYRSPTKPEKSFLCPPFSSTLTSPSKEKKQTIICPTCEIEMEIPAEGVQQFPVNYIVKKQLRHDSFNKEYSHTTCDLCNTESRATLYCTSCAASLCSFCSEAHKRQRKTSEHNIMSLHEARKQGLLKKPTSIFCPLHPQEELKMFCETCVKTVCRDCVIVTHREHLCHFVNEVSERQMALLRSALVQMQPCADNLKKWIESTRMASMRVELQVTQTEEEIEQFIAGYMEAVQEHCKNLSSELKHIYSEKQENLTHHRLQLEQALEDLENSFTFTNELLEYGSNVEILSLIGPLLKRLQELRRIRRIPDLSNELNSMKFLRFEKAESINNYPLIGIMASSFCPTKCIVKGDGLMTARHGHKSEIFLITRDEEGIFLVKDKNDIKAELIAKDNPLCSIPVHITDRQDGSYVISFCPDNPGLFLLHITLQGKPLQGSPFEIPVKPMWRKHTGIFHCCAFCSSGGRKDAQCACRGTMPGGYKGCGHGYYEHPGQKHWSCCGKLSENSECSRPHNVPYQFTL